jgi:glycosyltransferase involved in cell wall biosynthesis
MVTNTPSVRPPLLQPDHAMRARAKRRSGRGPLRLTVVSTYPPRRCGLAEYTADICDALQVVVPDWRVDVCAVDRDGLRYVPRVAVTLAQDEPADYARAADRIADRGTDLVLVQHEYGIFGGDDGRYVGILTRRLRERGVRYAVTLHTVLASPGAGKHAVLRELCAGAALVTVFTESARRMVVEAGLVDARRVAVVPHGAPPVLRAPVHRAALRPAVARALAGTGDDPVLSTFGLIGPGKGLEVALTALSDVVGRHPRVRYVVAGATHPEEARRHGESYRDGLVALAERLGLRRHVRFVDEYLTDAEVAALLARTDLYVTPYPSPEQACSGALTFAVAAGCPVVSTAYRYARELLARPPDGGSAPGVLVPCRDAGALASAVDRLLGDPVALAAARVAADHLGATLTWPAVAGRLAPLLRAAAGAGRHRALDPSVCRSHVAPPARRLAEADRRPPVGTKNHRSRP